MTTIRLSSRVRHTYTRENKIVSLSKADEDQNRDDDDDDNDNYDEDDVVNDG